MVLSSSDKQVAVAMLCNKAIKQFPLACTHCVEINEAPVALIKRKRSFTVHKSILRTVPTQQTQLREFFYVDVHGVLDMPCYVAKIAYRTCVAKGDVNVVVPSRMVKAVYSAPLVWWVPRNHPPRIHIHAYFLSIASTPQPTE